MEETQKFVWNNFCRVLRALVHPVQCTLEVLYESQKGGRMKIKGSCYCVAVSYTANSTTPYPYMLVTVPFAVKPGEAAGTVLISWQKR